MDYARFNYIAQPGDGVKVLSPHIGPYDMFAIEYGYRWYGKNTPEEEKALLFNFLSKHTDRLYKYSEAQDVRDCQELRLPEAVVSVKRQVRQRYRFVRREPVACSASLWQASGR